MAVSRVEQISVLSSKEKLQVKQSQQEGSN